MNRDNGNNRPGPAGNNGMVLTELKLLKERIKVLEAETKLLRGREKSSSPGAVVSASDHHKVRMLLLNLMVAIENHPELVAKAKKGGDLAKALEASQEFIRPTKKDTKDFAGTSQDGGERVLVTTFDQAVAVAK